MLQEINPDFGMSSTPKSINHQKSMAYDKKSREQGPATRYCAWNKYRSNIS